MSSGNKYHRSIYSGLDRLSVTIDVYDVLEAFNVNCPARQHAIKKLLCAGLRSKGTALQDLTETKEAVIRAIEMQQVREEINN